MRTLQYAVISYLLTVAFFASVCHADTDYHCLYSCVNAGANVTSCRQSCAYIPEAAQIQKQSMQRSKHNQFLTPIPIETLLQLQSDLSGRPEFLMSPNNPLQPVASKPAVELGKKLLCLSDCTQSGNMYQLCKQRCP